MTTPTGGVPSIGEDGVVSEGRPLQLHNLPTEIGIRRQPVNYTCLDASQQFLVVGSAQGYVWILELHSFRLLREYSEFKGNAVTVVKLNPHRDYVAYGTSHGFIKVDRISKIRSNKFRVQEKSGLSVISLEWGPNGDDVFCGFSTGRLVQFSVKFSERVMIHVPLFPDQYGSDIVQLSVHKNSLLVSTLERAFVLDTETSRLSQVGRKERKAGPYGGSHNHSDNSVMVARPGMRIWVADNDGNVQSTMAFKEILSNDYLPAVSISSVPTSTVQYTRSWQFTTLHPWLEGRFVVTFCEESIFVLDVLNGKLVGTSTFHYPIRALTVSGGVLYILLYTGITNKSIVRVSVHHSYMPVEMTLLKPMLITTSNSSTPIGSMENLLGDLPGEERDSVPQNDKLSLSEQEVDSAKSVTVTKDTGITNKPIAYMSVHHSYMPVEITLQKPMPISTSNSSTTVSSMENLLGDLPGEEHESVPQNAQNEKELSLSEKEVDSAKSVTVATDHSFMPVEITLQKPMPISSSNSSTTVNSTENLLRDLPGEEHDSVPQNDKELSLSEQEVDSAKSVTVAKAPLSDHERSRRQRMAEAILDDDDDIVVDKHSKKKKQRKKGKKVSSATSSRSMSMERLFNITEEMIGGNETEVNLESLLLPLSKDQSPSDVPLHNEDVETGDNVAAVEVGNPSCSSDGVAVIDNNSGQTFSNEDMPLDSQLQETAVSFTGESKPSEEKELESIESRTTIVATEEVTEDENAGALYTGEEWCSKGEFENEEEVAGKEGFQDENVYKSETVEKQDLEESENLKEETRETEVASSTSSRMGSGKHTLSPLEDITDNPLYQDTDEDLTSDISEERSTASTDYSREEEKHLLGSQLVKQHSLLQPAMSDPLQDEENLQTGTASARKPQWLNTTQPHRVRHQPQAHNNRHTITSWIEVNKKEAFYEKEQPPLFEASDSSHESEHCNEDEGGGGGGSTTGVDMSESMVVEDFYQLCGDLVENTAPSSLQPAALTPLEESGPTSLPARLLCECEEPEIVASIDRNMDEETWDSWFNVRYPGLSSLRCVCLSDQVLWVVNTRGKVYYTRANAYGRDWEHIKKTMQQVASSPSGKIVWGTYHQNAYVRLGIGMNAAGSHWKNITKSTSLAHKIKYLAVDENGVWAITVDGYVLFRREVSEVCPEGKVWKEIGDGKSNFASISCCNGVVWGITSNNKVLFRDGISPSSPSGTKWSELKSTRMAAVSLTSDGTAWGITEDGAAGFRTGVSPSKPGGRGPWWEVTVERQSHASSPISSLLQVISADGHRISVASLVSLPTTHHQSIVISASSKGGVVILEAGSKLYWCKKMITGYHYTPACKDDMFRFNTWSRVAVGRTATWFVKNDGGLYCLTPGGILKHVEVPATAELISASSNCLWVISKHMVWSRQGMTAEVPEGFSFDYIELSTLLHDTKLQSVACGKKVAWAVDTAGVPHFRFGVHAREPGTGMSPAWVPVEDKPAPLLHMAVCGDDWLVWACDENYNVYAREGVTVDFPVGRRWRAIPKLKIKELAATCDRMYGLTPEGELYCRQGISEKNIVGNFWRKLPGNYEHIATGQFGELFTLDGRGQVWKQEWRVVKISTEPTESDPDAWEVL